MSISALSEQIGVVNDFPNVELVSEQCDISASVRHRDRPPRRRHANQLAHMQVTVDQSGSDDRGRVLSAANVDTNAARRVRRDRRFPAARVPLRRRDPPFLRFGPLIEQVTPEDVFTLFRELIGENSGCTVTPIDGFTAAHTAGSRWSASTGASSQ